MNTFSIVFRQLLQFFLLMMTGVLMAKLKVVQEEGLTPISRLLTKLLLPVYVFVSCYGEMTLRDFVGNIAALLMIFGIYFLLFALFYLVAKCCPMLPKKRKRAFQAIFSFGNTAMIAVPMISAVCLEKGRLYITFLLIVDSLLLWTLGIALMTDADKQIKIKLSNFINPTVVAVMLAFVLSVMGLKIPKLVELALISISNSCSPMCLIYLGILLYFSDIKKVLKCREVYVGILIKMLLFPILIGKLLCLTSMDQELINLLIIVAMLPTVTVMPLFAKTYGSEGEYATGVTMMNIFISMFTLPLVAFIVMV